MKKDKHNLLRHLFACNFLFAFACEHSVRVYL